MTKPSKLAAVICLLPILLLTFLPAMIVQADVVLKPAAPSTSWQILPVDMPLAATAVVQRDVYVDLITLTNYSASSVTVYFYDRQDTPKVILKATIPPDPGSNNFVIAYPAPGRWAPGGITWNAGVAGAVTGYISGRY